MAESHTCLAGIFQDCGLAQAGAIASLQQVVKRSRMPEQLWLCIAELNLILPPEALAQPDIAFTHYHSFTRAQKAAVYYRYLEAAGFGALIAGLPDESIMLPPPAGAPLHTSLICFLLDDVCRWLHDARVLRCSFRAPAVLQSWQQRWGLTADVVSVLQLQVFHRAQQDAAVTLCIPCV